MSPEMADAASSTRSALLFPFSLIELARSHIFMWPKTNSIGL